MNSKPSYSLVAIAGLVGLGMAFYGTPAQAQQSEIDVLRQQIAELTNRLNTLEDSQKASAAATKAAPPATSVAKLPVQIGGLVQLQSLNYLNEDINNNGARSRDTFRLRRGEIRIFAPSITDRFSANVMFDLARSAGNNNAANINTGNILQDLQATYLLDRKPSGNIYVDFGQFKTPIGYEAALTSTSALKFLERSLIFTGRDNTNTTYGDQRDTGIQLKAVYPEVEARIGVFNGFGDRQNLLALSDAKAYMGLIAYKPKKIDGLALGVSGGTGNTGISTSVGNPAVVVNRRADRNIVNAFLAYTKPKFSLQGEYLRGKSNAIVQNATTVAARDVSGFYFGGTYYLTKKLELAARYDHLNTDRDASDADVTDYILGLNYYIKNNNAKLQLNLVKRDGGDNAPTSATNPASNYRNDRLELRSGVQLSF